MTVSLLVLRSHKGALLWAVEVLQPPLGSNYLPSRAAPSSCGDCTGATCFCRSAGAPSRHVFGEPARWLWGLKSFGSTPGPLSHCLITCSLPCPPWREPGELPEKENSYLWLILPRETPGSLWVSSPFLPQPQILSFLGSICPAAPNETRPKSPLPRLSQLPKRSSPLNRSFAASR